MNEVITYAGQTYKRICIRTHILSAKDDIIDVVKTYVSPHLCRNDLVFISEKAVACTQSRAIAMENINPRPLARLLVRFVHKSPHGIGISLPESMEMAFRECGTARILFAAAISAFGKLIGKRGWFYKIAGWKAAAIDGPAKYNIPPYDRCVILAPKDPDLTAKQLSKAVCCPVAIVDINDLGGNILGVSDETLNSQLLLTLLADNPLGQSCQQTPIGILRKA